VSPIVKTPPTSVTAALPIELAPVHFVRLLVVPVPPTAEIVDDTLAPHDTETFSGSFQAICF